MILNLDLIVASPEAQPREQMSEEAVARYAEAMTAGETFPAPVVFYDGDKHWLADGFHRIAARRRASIATIPCDVRSGGLKEAALYAAGANHSHGLPRAECDRKRAVLMAWRQVGDTWTQRQIAKHCHVSESWVSEVLGKVRTETSPGREQKRAAVIAAVAEHPTASNREVARTVGVDHKTVSAVRAEQNEALRANRVGRDQSGEAPRPAEDSGAVGAHTGADLKPAPRNAEFADQNHRDAVMSAAVVIKTIRHWKEHDRFLACDVLQRLIDEARNA